MLFSGTEEEMFQQIAAELQALALFSACVMRQAAALTLARTGDPDEAAWARGTDLTCALLRDVIAAVPEGGCEVLKSTLSSFEKGETEPGTILRIVRTADDPQEP